MTFFRSILFQTMFLSGLTLTLTGCTHATAEAPAVPLTMVTVSHPIERSVTDYNDLTGRTSAPESVEVRARVNGYLDKINFKEGTLVKKGDVLFEIDPRPYQAQVDFAIAQVAANEALQTKAKSNNLRYKTLQAKSPSVVTQQDLVEYQAAEDQSIAVVQQSKATLATNQLSLSFTKIMAPIDGRASRYNVTVGNLVMQESTLLTTIVSVDPMYAYFDVDERMVLNIRQMIRAGKTKSARDVEWPVMLGLANETGYPHQGTINFVDNQVNPKTGTLSVRAVFENKQEVLSAGLFTRVRVPIGPPHQALLITDRAIDSDQGQKIVYVVNEKDEIVSRPIVVGAVQQGLRVVEEGLKAGDRVVVSGLQRVRPGLVVDAKLVDMPVPKVIHDAPGAAQAQ
jgi:RND family efflux transporter MFP subunit